MSIKCSQYQIRSNSRNLFEKYVVFQFHILHTENRIKGEYKPYQTHI